MSPDKCKQLEQTVVTELAYLASIKEHSDEATFSCILSERQAQLESMICEGETLDAKLSLLLVDLVKKSEIPDHSKKTVINTIIGHRKKAQKSALQQDQEEDKCKQSCLNYHLIMPYGLWKTMLNPDTPEHVLIPEMKKHMQNIGLVFANEPTYVHIIAIMVLCRMQCMVGNNNVDAFNCKNVMDSLKKAIRLERKKVFLPHYREIKLYPSNPDDFKNNFPLIFARAFNDDAPENQCCRECPLDLTHLGQLDAMLPARSNHSSLSMLYQGLRNSVAMRRGRLQQPLVGPANSQGTLNVGNPPLALGWIDADHSSSMAFNHPPTSEHVASPTQAITNGSEHVTKEVEEEASAEPKTEPKETCTQPGMPVSTQTATLALKILKQSAADAKTEQSADAKTGSDEAIVAAPAKGMTPAAVVAASLTTLLRKKKGEKQAGGSTSKAKQEKGKKQAGGSTSEEKQEKGEEQADGSTSEAKTDGGKSTIKKRPAAKAASTEAASKKSKVSLPWPGDPRKHHEAIHSKGWKIYTSKTYQMYRAQKLGCVKDKSFPFRQQSPEDAWAEMLGYVSTH